MSHRGSRQLRSAADVGFGTDLTPEVAAALPALLDGVLADIADDVGNGDAGAD